MADDALGLLDTVNIEKAHIIGYSLGGMIGLELTLRAPNRVKTLTALGSTARQLRAEQYLLEVVKSAKSALPVEDFWKLMGNKVMSWRFFENEESVGQFNGVTSEFIRSHP